MIHIGDGVIRAGLIGAILTIVTHGRIVKEHVAHMTGLTIQRVAGKGGISDSALIIEALAFDVDEHIGLTERNVDGEELLTAGGRVVHLHVHVILCGTYLAGHTDTVAVGAREGEVENVLVQLVTHVVGKVLFIHVRVLVETACGDHNRLASGLDLFTRCGFGAETDDSAVLFD